MAETRQWAWYVFKQEMAPYASRCSECGDKISRGEPAWVSRTSSGRIAKRVCSIKCGETFDYREMSNQARLRRRGELGDAYRAKKMIMKP